MSTWQLLARRARTFRLAALLLPPDRRQEVALLYAFCRAADDAADEGSSPAAARAALATLRGDLLGATPGTVAGETAHLLARHGAPAGAALQLIEGVRGDLGAVRVADDAELLRYAYLVAGTVGLMMCALLGATDRRARAPAVDLGIAMQLTNICRDVLEDARRGRVYLPASRLRAAGTSPEALVALADGAALTDRAAAADRGAVARVVAEVLTLAEGYYASAEAGLGYLPRRSRLVVLVASRLYRAIGRRLLQVHGGDALAGRVIVPWWSKALWLGRALGSWLAFAYRRRRLPPHRAELHAPLHGLVDG
jgi:phytoene synthase